MTEMESPSGQDEEAILSSYEVAIWCTVSGRDEEEVKEIVYKYCQALKESFGEKLIVKAVEVGLNSFQP